MQRIKVYSIEEVEAIVKDSVVNSICNKSEKMAGGSVELEGHQVYRRSLRYKTFIEKGYKCVCCGRTGAYYALEKSNGSKAMRAHFNLYSDDDVLMTKDHIFPKSKGGRDCIENMQTMCSICNSEKGSVIPDGYVPSEAQKKKDNRCYIWCGIQKFKTMDKAVNSVAHGNKKSFYTVRKHIQEAIENGTLYCGKVWRYGKEIEHGLEAV